jgi:hypothetical protein
MGKVPYSHRQTVTCSLTLIEDDLRFWVSPAPLIARASGTAPVSRRVLDCVLDVAVRQRRKRGESM